MFLEEITVVETARCISARDGFKATAKASVDITELMPYLNAVIDKPNYQPQSKSLVFKKGKIEFVLRGVNISLKRFTSITGLYELLDELKDLINVTYERRSDIEPNYKARKIIPTLKIYNLLPKKNCRKCGEYSCMAFAAMLCKYDAEIDDCHFFRQSEFAEQRDMLIALIEQS